MKATRIILISIAAVALITGAAAGYVLHARSHRFPPVGVICADQAFESLSNSQANPELIPNPFTYAKANIAHFRCAAGVGFSQYEMSGIDDAGHAFYIHSSAGGMAASGADSLLDFCYVKDGAVVTQLRISGRAGNRSEGRCSYDPDFLKDAQSQYEYFK